MANVLSHKNELLFKVSCILITLIASFTVIAILTDRFSLSDVTIEKWDGVSVASSFSAGNGSEDNPYVINSGEELVYFKSLIEGNQSSFYNDKYYVLGKNIDLDYHEIVSIGTKENNFKGSFDGAGHTINNLKVGSMVIDNYEYYGLFSILENASINNLNINGMEIIANENINPIKMGALAGEVRVSESEEEVLSDISNISINSLVMNLSATLENKDSSIGSLVGDVSNKVLFNNIYINSSIDVNYNNGVSKIVNNLNSDSNNIISYITSTLELNDYNNIATDIDVSNQYKVLIDGDSYSVSLNDTVVNSDELIIDLNNSLNSNYYWVFENGVFNIRIVNNVSNSVQDPVVSTFAFGRSAPIPLHDSGIDVANNIIYINDLDSDYNYYKGLNYTSSSTGLLPTGANQNIYNDNNLIKVYMQYNGSDIEGNYTGYVSLEEQVSKFNYYKYYVVENGVVSFELIDHPFADRPDNKAFGGWYTDYVGAKIRYDKDVHVYYVDIPVTDISSPISITFYANWIDASTGNVTATTAAGWTNALANLKNAGYYIYGKTPVYESVTPYYTQGTVARYSRYPSGAYNVNGGSVSGTCRTSGGCVYYRHPTSATYDDTETYYQLINGSMAVYEIQAIRYDDDPDGEVPPVGDVAAGYYKLVTIPQNSSLVGYYSASGNYYNSGTCTTAGGCLAFELLSYYDDSGNVNVINDTDTYAYLVTRDTNILVLRANNGNRLNTTKPLTLTTVNNGTDYTNYLNLRSTYLGAQADLRIEYITIRTSIARNGDATPSGNAGDSGNIYGNLHNLKVGRGVVSYNTYCSAGAVVGSQNDSSTGSEGNATRYRMIVESGYQNTMSVANGYNSSGTYYIDGIGIYGCDYDRVAKNNDNLDVYATSAGNWGGSIYGPDDKTPAITTIVKSGTFGSSKYDYATGIYVGGLNYGTLYAPRAAIVEGGYIFNLLGGPLSDEDTREDKNDIYINMKGGEVDLVFGGAGRSETYGNRILNLTGGNVNYAVFGGSNGYSGNNSQSYRGTLTSSTFLYLGGNVTVGNEDYISAGDNWYGEEIGSVFAIGNGNDDYDMIGTAKTSHLVIDGDATINTNVYGGGNFGAVGINNDSTTSTKIDILGGTIKGSVYGGGNNNGSGATDVKANIDINMTGGVVNGSIYGGSNTSGIIYGDTNVNVLGGIVGTDIYGGGRGGYQNASNQGTFVSQKSNVNIGRATNPLNLEVNGSVYGGSAFGTVNGTTNSTTTVSQYGTNVTVNNGTIKKAVFGGGKGGTFEGVNYTPYVLGNVLVTINGGNIGNVYGGNDAAGSPNGTDIVYLNGGIIGDCFGGGNATGQKTTDIYLQGASINNLFGGSNQTGTVDSTKVTVTSGSVNNIYGGNNVGGLATATNVSVSGGTINGDIYGGGYSADSGSSIVKVSAPLVNNVYGGGESASVDTTDVTINGSTGNYVFGGSNIEGDVTESKVTINSGVLDRVYGGNNAGGVTSTTNVIINNGTIGYVFGGGQKAESGISNVDVYNGTITDVYGGGNEAGLNTSNVNIIGGDITNVFGGSNQEGNLTQSNVVVGDVSQANPVSVDFNLTKADIDPYWQDTNYSSYITAEVTLTNNTDTDISDWELLMNFSPDTVLNNNWSNTEIVIADDSSTVNSVNIYGGYNTLAANGGTYTFTFYLYSKTAKESFDIIGEILKPEATIDPSVISVDNVYGGNNAGGITASTNVDINFGTISDVYGGGNEANVGETYVTVNDAVITNMYGGGNAADVSGNTYLDITDSTLNTNVYGGGNEGKVLGNTETYITSCNVLGSAYAGGNGSTAVVSGNTTITIDGKSVIGSLGCAVPSHGSVFGGGNAAATGVDGVNTSVATVNIVGATVYGNVYGGANTSVVYGRTYTNIGTDAVNKTGLEEDDVVISGTIFGGGEANASGSEIYDWNFISVTDAIDVYIDGTDYIENGHKFEFTGSIFGSGNASSSAGTSTIYVKNLGTVTAPSRNVSVQRTNLLTIDHSVIELKGIKDRTNEYVDIPYTFNQIDKLIIKNGTTLMLKKNANLLKELYSGVDVNGELVPAKVEIDDETKSVTKNVDNRIYMIPNNNLNVTINQAATAYGKVTGMTFFGMYNSYDTGALSFGVYDRNITYGSEADAGDVIIGGSYVIGLHALNHDITVDGFYSNYVNDSYTEAYTAYIDPTEIGETGYRWAVGLDATNYTVDLTATKYSSMGTGEASLMDFDDGDTTFTVVGFNSEGLKNGVELVDSNEVPKITNTTEEANQILGLSMKSETREWTGYNTTKLLSENNGKFVGDNVYKTDSQKLPPSLMFYFYHAKNISLNGELGTVVVSLEAYIPINEIEGEIKLITITVNLYAKDVQDEDAYDASITYDKKYDMPSATSVNITNQSQFTTYFSLYAEATEIDDIYGYNNSNYHVLVTDYALPIGSQITMIDYGLGDDTPDYYYFTITEDIYNASVNQLATNNEIAYRLSDFIRMGSTSTGNTYDDKAANESYYSSQFNRTVEEFIFIFDLKDTNTTGTHANNNILFELRNSEDRAVITVLGTRQGLMKYSLYDSSNAVLQEIINNESNYLYYDIANKMSLTTDVDYIENENRQAIIDTNYESSAMGLNVYLYDSSGNQVSSSMLLGTSIKLDNKLYFVDSDGVWRIKLANKVSNLFKNFEMTVDSLLPAGKYTLKFVLFASSDGVHNSSLDDAAVVEKEITVVGNDNAIVVSSDDKTKVVDGDTSLNSLGIGFNAYTITYHSVLSNPNIRLSLYKRNIDTESTVTYTEISINDLFTNNFSVPNNIGFVGSSDYERIVTTRTNETQAFNLQLKDNLTSGTYKLVFKLYDNNQLIQDDIEYVIVKKKVS